MHYRILILSILMALFTTACGGDEIVVPETNVDVNAEATTEPTAPAVVVVTRSPAEELPEGALEIPLPGTLVASETEDPDIDLVFDRILFIRSGGGEDIPRVEIEILQSGLISINGTPSNTIPQTIINIDNMIDEINFFGMQGAMLGPSADNDDFRYSLTVQRGDLERTIQSQDGFMPAVYEQLLGEILRLGLGQ